MFVYETTLPSRLMPYEAYTVISLTFSLLRSTLYGEGGQTLPIENIITSLNQISDDVVKKILDLLNKNDIRWSVADRIVLVNPDTFFDISKSIRNVSNEVFVTWIANLIREHQWIITHPTMIDTLNYLFIYEETNVTTYN